MKKEIKTFEDLRNAMADALIEAAIKAGPLPDVSFPKIGTKLSKPKFVTPRGIFKHAPLDKNIDFNKYIKF